MRERPRTKHELRCFCAGQPLLAMYGLDSRGRLYIHQKVYKAGVVFGESIFYGGTVELLCRKCLRWQKVVFRSPGMVALEESDVPEMLRDEVDTRSPLHIRRPNR